MSLIAALRRKWNYSVENPGAGRLVYREGNHEYTFPVYEEDGVLVVAAVPSSHRIHLFFSSHSGGREFSTAASERILPRITEHLQQGGARVKIFDRAGDGGEKFEFYPELFEHRNRASELLEEAGYTWFSDFSALEPLHEDYGLEVCGIQNERDIRPILEALQRGFPQWHHQKISRQDGGREPGWTAIICMFPSQTCNSGWFDED